jgi:cyclic pyranopterin phosphate synthase
MKARQVKTMAMIDISEKEVTQREAIVEARIFLKARLIELIKKGKVPKGNVLEAAKLAGIIAAKKTSELIPLCHPIPIEYAQIDFHLGRNQIKLTAIVRGNAKTGVEMEAFVAVSTACLTIYDMCKNLDRGIVISEIKLMRKTGGKSGMYIRPK